MNPCRLQFKFDTDDPEYFTLDISIFKYLATELIKVDVQPNYVRVALKDSKYFQLALPEEILHTKSQVVRSKANGHLVIKMPLVNPDLWKIKLKKEAGEKLNDKSIAEKGLGYNTISKFV